MDPPYLWGLACPAMRASSSGRWGTAFTTGTVQAVPRTLWPAD